MKPSNVSHFSKTNMLFKLKLPTEIRGALYYVSATSPICRGLRPSDEIQYNVFYK